AACAVGWMMAADRFAGAAGSSPTAERFAAAIRARTARPVVFFRAEAHDLAWHVGRPVVTLVEWENLDGWLRRPFPVYVVMPADEARHWRQHLRQGTLEEVLRTTDVAPAAGERPLVLFRAVAGPASNDRQP